MKTVSRFGDTNKSTIGQRVNQAMEDARSQPYRFSVQARDVYHSRRQGQVNSVRYSQDGFYILSGSQEGNMRVWKAQANQKEKAVNGREFQQDQLNAALIKKFQNVGEMRTVLRSGKLPKRIQNMTRRMMTRDQAQLKKLEARGQRFNALSA